MCGYGENNLIVKQGNIKQINDFNKVLKISGKKKRKRINLLIMFTIDGAHVLKENEYIIELITDSNETKYFSPKVSGKLLEINSNLNNETLTTSVKYLF